MNQPWQIDVVSNLLAGQDAASDPDILSQNAAAYLRNVSLRGGRPKSRPRIRRLADIPAGKIQGAAGFNRISRLLVSVDGKIYELNPATWAATELTKDPASLGREPVRDDAIRANPNRRRHYYCETAGSMVIQDGQTFPFIYDGADFRVAKSGEVPRGWMMEFSNGRLAVVTNNGSDVRIGDIRKPAHQSELKFEETTYLTGGGDFGFKDRLTALCSLPVVDSATGQGSLIVGARGRAYSLKTELVQRDMWGEIGMQTELFPSVGITGATAVAKVNQDLYFRALDGIRSVRAAAADYSSPGQTPLSREVANRLDHDSPIFLQDASMVEFDNRILVTHSPKAYGNRAIFTGLIAYNFDSLSKGGQKSPPVYEGEWDGVEIAELVAFEVNGIRRCFIVGRDAEGENGLWEIQREADGLVTGSDSPVQEIVTRSLFGAGGNILKALRRLDVNLSGVSGPVNLKVYFRPDRYPYWIQWDEFDLNVSSPSSWNRKHPQYRNPISTRTAPEILDGVVAQMLNTGLSFQIRVVWTGQATIDMLQLHTQALTTPGVADNAPETASTVYMEVPPGAVEQTYWHRQLINPHPPR